MNISEISKTGKHFRADSNLAKRCTLETKDHNRDAFEIDRDRILYSKEFRRLSGKTQVFAAGFDDLMRTRLTHTLEVAHISKAMATNLGLNVDLAEAIALGHDVGHAPFGHVGERTLNHIMIGCILKDINFDYSKAAGFKHNLQSIRVLTHLEKTKLEYSGLNLTNFTLWGVRAHTDLNYSVCKYLGREMKCSLSSASDNCQIEGITNLDIYDVDSDFINSGESFEALVVSIADEIAQRHHDIEDGLYAKLISGKEVLWQIEKTFRNFLDLDKITELMNAKVISSPVFMPRLSSFIIEMYRVRYAESLAKRFEKLMDKWNKLYPNQEVKLCPELFKEFRIIEDDNFAEFEEQDKNFKDFLKSMIITSELAQVMDEKAEYVIRHLFTAYVKNPLLLPDNTIRLIFDEFEPNNQLSAHEYRLNMDDALRKSKKEFNQRLHMIVHRKICDHLAGMTDQYAMEQYHKLVGTNSFRRGT